MREPHGMQIGVLHERFLHVNLGGAVMLMTAMTQEKKQIMEFAAPGSGRSNNI